MSCPQPVSTYGPNSHAPVLIGSAHGLDFLLLPRTKDTLVVVVLGLAGVVLVVPVVLFVDIMLVDGDTTALATANQ